MAYRAPFDAAFAMHEVGASLPVSYAVTKDLEAYAREAVAELMFDFLSGPLLPMRYPADWNPEAVQPIPWASYAKDAGEPVDLAAWEAFAAERHAFNYPDDPED